jgi:predicted phage terminase large subunit-like protein
MMEMVRKEKHRRALERTRERCKSFAGFVKEAWHIIEPTTPLVWGFYLQAMCDHLEAITFGKLHPRLIINVPPGSSKSTIITVLWQAWEWGPCGRPSVRFVTTAFEFEAIKRDTRKTRNIVMSEWFQSLWPEVALTRYGETSFENTATGFREGIAFGSITGKRGDRLVVDDPHSIKQAESEKERGNAIRDFLEGGLNRVNDLKTSAIVVVMQRIHELDLTGALLAQQFGFIHLYIPMEFEADRRCVTPLPWSDPRTYDGELMDPIRFPAETLSGFKTLSYMWAGQYQQRPAPREGALFKLSWFADKMVDQAPRGTVWVRHWDLAATKSETAARTAGVKLGRAPDGTFYVGHVFTTQSEGNEVRRFLKHFAEADGKSVEISLPQDPGQSGKVQAQDMILMLAGWNVHAEPETGNKEDRALPFAAQCEAGNVFVVRGDWNQVYFDELGVFPAGRFKDQVDASSGAFGRLIQKPKQMNVSDEVLDMVQQHYAGQQAF